MNDDKLNEILQDTFTSLVDVDGDVCGVVVVEDRLNILQTPEPTEPLSLEGIQLKELPAVTADVNKIELRPTSPSIDQGVSEKVSVTSVPVVDRDTVIRDIEELQKFNESIAIDRNKIEQIILQDLRRIQQQQTVVSTTQDEEGNQALEAYLSELSLYEQTRNEFTQKQLNGTKQIEILSNLLKDLRDKTQELISNQHKARRKLALKSKYTKTLQYFPKDYLIKFEKREAEDLEKIKKSLMECLKLESESAQMKLILDRKQTMINGKQETTTADLSEVNIIEYEQIKIENQSLQEKIEISKGDLEKIESKVRQLVHLRLHLSEKLQFETTENHVKLKQCQKIEDEIIKLKEQIPRMKKERDQMRREVKEIKGKCGFLLNKDLLEDFETKVDQREQMSRQVEEIKQKILYKRK